MELSGNSGLRPGRSRGPWNATSLPVWGWDGTRLDALELALALAPGETNEIPVEIRPPTGDAIRGACIYALTEEQAAKTQQRARRTKLKGGKRLGEQAVESAKYVMLFTTVPYEMMTTAQVCATYGPAK